MSSACKFSILDVGHGNSAVLVDDDGVVIIDAGPNTTLLEFLEQEEINHISLVLISHSDADHIRGLLALVGTGLVQIDKVYLNSDAQQGSDLWDDLIFVLDDENKSRKLEFNVSLHAGMNHSLSRGRIKIDVLAPSSYLIAKGPGSQDRNGNIITTNTISAVILLSINDIPLVLLPGDIDAVGLQNLIEAGESLEAKIAVFPHHGGKPGGKADVEKFAYDFSSAVQPEVMLFSIGRHKFRNPIPEVISVVRNTLPGVRIACTQLSKHCESTIKFNNTPYLTDAYAGGKEKGLCCAGTLQINFDLSEELNPLNLHQDFVLKHVSQPLCFTKNKPLSPPLDLFLSFKEDE